MNCPTCTNLLIETIYDLAGNQTTIFRCPCACYQLIREANGSEIEEFAIEAYAFPLISKYWIGSDGFLTSALFHDPDFQGDGYHTTLHVANHMQVTGSGRKRQIKRFCVVRIDGQQLLSCSDCLPTGSNIDQLHQFLIDRGY